MFASKTELLLFSSNAKNQLSFQRNDSSVALKFLPIFLNGLAVFSINKGALSTS